MPRCNLLIEARRKWRALFYGNFKHGRSSADPDAMFDCATSAIDNVVALPDAERVQLMSSITIDESQFLHSVIPSLATRAFNARRESDIRYGMRALLIEGASGDWRESVAMWALLQHAAQCIDIDMWPIYVDEQHLGNGDIRKVCEGNLLEAPICLADYRWECVPFDGMLLYKPISARV